MSGQIPKYPPAALSDEPMPKRISTPAGDRLSTIIEGGGASHLSRSTRSSSRLSMNRVSAGLGLPPRESHEQSYTTIWSDANLPVRDSEKVDRSWRDDNFFLRRGGWKRLILLILIFVIIIVGVVLGLVFGLKSRNSKQSAPPSTKTNADTTPTSSFSSSSSGSSSDPDPTPTHTAAAAPSASSTPSKFPIGTYSMVTYLSTVQTNCTSNPDTWTCFPYSTYGENQAKSMTTFNWNITAGSSPDTYKISSTDDPFSVSFSNVDLNIVDKGQASEHYMFQLTYDKQVQPSASLTDDDATTTCFYNATTFQSYLYTQMAKDYPSSGIKDANASYTEWPFAMRVEEVAGGGDNVPNCYKTNNNVVGDQIDSDSLKPQAGGELCDCLYLNWFP
ncbi:hypothetical protein NA57DRAFT_69233 [Rhizodiscina lignyota]|uniref:Tat pathway signal sequence n=1 Tax=Rhizodiscina lignyota TaxID=1504668 RepID=A0A9P4M1J2_9PEZI|nr:hypothetical protein NA57DRAFT_69233 [Rhizodiscina lignyota]